MEITTTALELASYQKGLTAFPDDRGFKVLGRIVHASLYIH